MSELVRDAQVIPPDSAIRQQLELDGDHRVFVEAGAGSGKTTTLVSRVANLVIGGATGSAPIDISEVVAITFTEAAAAELKMRLRERFREEALNKNGSEAGDARLLAARALDDLDLAMIGTIHSLCARILSEFCLEAGLPVGVQVLDELASEAHFATAWRGFLDGLAGADYDVVVDALMTKSSGLAAMRELCRRLGDGWQLLDPDNSAEQPSPDPGALIAAVQQMRESMVLCTKPDDKLFVRMQDFLDAFTPTGGLKGIDCSAGVARNWQGQLLQVREVAKRVNSALSEFSASVTSLRVSRLTRVLAKFELERAALRAQNGTVEFHDLLVLTHRLLVNSERVLETLRRRYRRILVDEFQDTDPLQLEIVRLLSGHSPLFTVGDPKQSIYGFRGADVGAFLDAKTKSGSEALFALVANFRSAPQIVEFVNATFEVAMARAYSDDDDRAHVEFSALEAVRPRLSDGSGPSVVVVGWPVSGLVLEARLLEAEAISRQIRRALDTEFRVFDPEIGTERQIKPSDIVILLPARTGLSVLLDALRSFEIPTRLETGSLLWATAEAREILVALEAAANPGDQVAVYGYLRGPGGSCSIEEIAKFVLDGGVIRADEIAGITPSSPGSAKVLEALSALRVLALNHVTEGIASFVSEFVHQGGWRVWALAQRFPRDSLRLVDAVVDEARRFEEEGGRSLLEFISSVRSQESDRGQPSPNLPEPDDESVRVMTIHGAKGLEFPMVCLAGMATVPASQAGVSVIFGDGPLPEVKLDKSTVTRGFDAMAEVQESMSAAERVRLLYVGCTRARDHLVVSAFHKPVGTSPAKESEPDTSRWSSGRWMWECAAVDSCERIAEPFAGDASDGASGVNVAMPDAALSEAALSEAALSEAALSEAALSEAALSEAALSEAALLEHPTQPPGAGDPTQIEALKLARSEAEDRVERRKMRAPVTLSPSGLGHVLSAASVESVDSIDENHLVAGAERDADESLEGIELSALIVRPSARRPRRVELGYPVRATRAATAFGRAVHAALEQTLRARDAGIAIDLEAVAVAMTSAESIPERAVEVASAVTLGIESEVLSTALKDGSRLHPELPVSAKFGDRLLEGFIDLMIEHPDGSMSVIDYKTDVGRSDADLIESYELQLGAYCVALEKCTAGQVKRAGLLVCHVDASRLVEIDDLETLKLRVSTLISGLD